MNKNEKISVVWIAAVLFISWAPGASAGLAEPIYVVDSPTAGLLGDGEYMIQGRVGPESSIHLGLRIGFMNRIHMGASFGMQRVFERDEISVNDRVGFQVRVRLLEEFAAPALAVGFNSQGVGVYDEGLERYERKSRGFYAVASKNSAIAVGQLSVHFGVNYSTETEDEEGVNAFAAVDWEIFEGFALVMDADAARNDSNEDGRYGGGGVYLDGAVRITYGENLSMMLIFRDLSGNLETNNRVGREFEINFVRMF